MRINHNIAALNTYRQLTSNQALTSRSLAKLSSGLRINTAADDAAGLAISEKMRGQVRGLDMAAKNAQDGISLIRTAEGSLNETHSILQRMRELAVQSTSDTNTITDRAELQKEVDQLLSEVDRISATTEFNTMKLLDGSLSGARGTVNPSVAFDNRTSTAAFSAVNMATPGEATNTTLNVRITGATATVISLSWSNHTGGTDTATVAGAGGTATISGFTLTVGATTAIRVGDEATFTGRATVNDPHSTALTFQIGANSSQVINVGIEDMNSAALHIRGLNVTNAQSAGAAISAVTRAIDDVSAQRSMLGAFDNRLDHTINNLGTASENLSAAESRIRDVDMAREMMQFTKMSILSQAAQAMLAQATQQPQGVLQLLG